MWGHGGNRGIAIVCRDTACWEGLAGEGGAEGKPARGGRVLLWAGFREGAVKLWFPAIKCRPGRGCRRRRGVRRVLVWCGGRSGSP